jgi:hypothetical protein
MTILLEEFKKKSFVHFTSHLTTTAAACQNQAYFLTRTRSKACSLDYHFITFKNRNPMNILQRPNRKGDKLFFHFDLGRGKGQRPSTGIFIYTKPKNQIQKNHNKQALALLETKKSEAIIEQQAIDSAFIPAHKFKENFLDYFEDYIKIE